MTGPRGSIKLFDIRLVAAVAGLVLGGRYCGPILDALPALGIDTASVGIFRGAEGVPILDPKPHGLGQRILRFFEGWGNQAEIMSCTTKGCAWGSRWSSRPRRTRNATTSGASWWRTSVTPCTASASGGSSR